MYDHIEQHMRGKNLYEKASQQLDKQNRTPLSLAAEKVNSCYRLVWIGLCS
jgi:hypothetical protein